MRLTPNFETEQRITMTLSESDQSFKVDCGESQKVVEYVGGQVYEGEYTITPKIDAQTMPTKDKVLTNDVTVKAIPFFNVSNTSGGNTVYIGTEV